MIAIKPFLKLPRTARQICWLYNGIVVGGAVNWLIEETFDEPRDIDIVVPIDEWQRANKLLIGAESVEINALGGIFFVDIHMETGKSFGVDIWPEDTMRMLSLYPKPVRAFHVKSGTLFELRKIN